jgi:hypothetical protein
LAPSLRLQEVSPYLLEPALCLREFLRRLLEPALSALCLRVPPVRDFRSPILNGFCPAAPLSCLDTFPSTSVNPRFSPSKVGSRESRDTRLCKNKRSSFFVLDALEHFLYRASFPDLRGDLGTLSTLAETLSTLLTPTGGSDPFSVLESLRFKGSPKNRSITARPWSWRLPFASRSFHRTSCEILRSCHLAPGGSTVPRLLALALCLPEVPP